jgi:hypothetical protein
LYPAVTSARRRGKQIKAEADVRATVTAWTKYLNEYGKWPVDNNILMDLSAGSQNAGEDGMSPVNANGMLMNGTVMKNIMYPDASWAVAGHGGVNDSDEVRNYNPKRLQLMQYEQQAVNEDGDFLDPWGNLYRFMLDVNRDGKVEWNNGTEVITVYKSAIAWSQGPDGENKTEDDIRSWGK